MTLQDVITKLEHRRDDLIRIGIETLKNRRSEGEEAFQDSIQIAGYARIEELERILNILRELKNAEQETQEDKGKEAAKHNIEVLNDLVLNDKKSADDFYEYAYAFLGETYRNIRKFANKAANPTCSSVNARKWKLIDLLEGELWGICQEWNDIKPSEDDLKHNL